MTTYTGMSCATGSSIHDIEHIKQSVRDILLTPVGSRIARREYGSLLLSLLDRPQNEALKLQLMSAIYAALHRWEPRLKLSAIKISNASLDGALSIELAGVQNGSGVSFSVSTR